MPRAGEDGAVFLDRLFTIAEGNDKRLALAAIEILLTRGFGKAPGVQVALNPAVLRELSDEDLAAALRVAERLSAA